MGGGQLGVIPWEQLLHDRAPGAEADLSMLAEEGSVQIIPYPPVFEN